MRMIFLTGLVSLILMLAPFNTVADDTTDSEKYTEVKLNVGDVFRICNSGLVVCPVSTPICDDASLVTLVDTPDGLGFKAKACGTTLCSVESSVGQRFIFRLIVN